MMEFLLKLENLAFSEWLHESNSIFAFPMFLFMHALGMSMIAGVSAVIDLACLGFWPRMPVKPLGRLYPLLWAGFWINVVTGSALTISDATTKLTNPVFYIKMAFVAGGVMLLFVMRRRIFENPELDHAPLSGSARRLAWVSLFCWLGAITAGRLLAYLGPVSGAGNLTNH
jgi:hypothetical protein